VSTLLILGAGGHGRAVADAALASGAWTRVIAAGRNPQPTAAELLPGVEILPWDRALEVADTVHVAIGDAAAREREATALRAGMLAGVVHPRASVSAYAQVSPGCFIAAQSVVAPRASLGVAVIVNHGAVVDHEVEVGDYSHIAPLVALGGAVRIGRRVFMGSGASVLPGRRVADGIVVGSGAVVIDNLTEPGVYAGVPARRVK
jgi:sugar O-acyltransferase (sialic acid O-acetyltransferase NeuD family)